MTKANLQDWRRRVVQEFEVSSVRDLLSWLRDQGHSASRAASIIGISPNTFIAECDRLGVEYPRYRMPSGRPGCRQPKRERLLPFAGERLPMREIERRTGIGHTTIKYRIDVLKWPVERAVSTPPKGR